MYTESANLPAALLGIVLPWLQGALLARLLLGHRVNLPSVLAHGLLLGYISVLILLVLYDRLGRPFSYPELISIVGLLTLALGLFLARASRSPSVDAARTLNTTRRGLRVRARAAVALLLGLIFLQVAFVASEVILRPTYAWDAWSSWAPETLQHFSSQSFDVVLDTSSNYGLMHKAIHLWTMLAAGTYQSHIAYLPWILCYAAILLAVYGSLAGLCSAPLGAFAAFLVGSLPLLATHAALPGYGDIWVALCFTLGGLVLAQPASPLALKRTLLVLIYVVAGAVAKRAGLALALPLLAVLMMQWAGFFFPRAAPWLLAGVMAALSLVFGGIAMGWFSIEIPFAVGKIAISRHALAIEPLFSYPLAPDMRITPLMQSLFQFASWGLLFPVLALTLLYRAVSQPSALLRDPEPGLFVLGLIIIFLFYVLAAPESAADHTGIDRTLLIVAPLAVHWIVRVVFAPAPENTGDLVAEAESQRTPARATAQTPERPPNQGGA